MASELQQYTCPKCMHIGASGKGHRQAPLCDQCNFKVRMMKSHNGVIVAYVKVKMDMKLIVEFNVEQPLPHHLGGDIITGMMLAGKTERKIPSVVNGHINELFSGANFRINNMDTHLEIEDININEEDE